eukprot:4692895-Prymnesium_polylepis.1
MRAAGCCADGDLLRTYTALDDQLYQLAAELEMRATLPASTAQSRALRPLDVRPDSAVEVCTSAGNLTADNETLRERIFWKCLCRDYGGLPSGVRWT